MNHIKYFHLIKYSTFSVKNVIKILLKMNQNIITTWPHQQKNTINHSMKINPLTIQISMKPKKNTQRLYH